MNIVSNMLAPEATWTKILALPALASSHEAYIHMCVFLNMKIEAVPATQKQNCTKRAQKSTKNDACDSTF